MEVLYSRTKSSTTLVFGGKRVRVEPEPCDCIYFVEGTQFASDNELALELNGKYYRLLENSTLPVAGCVKTDLGFVGLCSASNTSKAKVKIPFVPITVGIVVGVLCFILTTSFTTEKNTNVAESDDEAPQYVTIVHKIAQKIRGSGANAIFDAESNDNVIKDKNRVRPPKPTNIDTSELEALLAKESIRTLESVPLNIPSGRFTADNPLFIIRNTTGKKIKVTVEAEGNIVWTSYIDKNRLEYFNVYDNLLMEDNSLEVSIEGEGIDEHYSVEVWLK